MPGVQAGTEGFSGLYVRGGGPDQNLILLDGIPVYNADHLLGVFSVFTPEAIKNTTLYKSSFPARYGGRLSSIVDIRTNDGDMHHYHGALSVGTLTDKLHFECAVGYGIGANFDNAIRNSVNARKEAVQFGKSFIQNENGDMIGPLGSSDRRVIQNQYVQNLGKIAKQCNLSPVTIKKVLASTHAAGSNKITTHELAERMGSTVRNANRSNS